MTPLATRLTPTMVKDRIDDMLERVNDFETPVQREPFQAHSKGVDIIVTNSKGNRRTIRHQDAVAFIRKWLGMDEPRVGDFQEDTHNASYLFALVTATLRDGGDGPHAR